MDYGKRKTGKYNFKDPKIDKFISLIPEIECSADFQKKYGSIIPLMKLKMKEDILSTLSSFMIRCIIALLSMSVEAYTRGVFSSVGFTYYRLCSFY